MLDSRGAMAGAARLTLATGAEVCPGAGEAGLVLALRLTPGRWMFSRGSVSSSASSPRLVATRRAWAIR